MNEGKLACCVVRDLLPAYIEELTEPETSALVKRHLEGCDECRAVEAEMRAQLPIEKAPKRALRFLQHAKRTRLIAAFLTLVLTLWCMWWLYDQEFHYANTEAGRLAAVEDYVPSAEDSTVNHIKTGTPLRVVAYAERDEYLHIFYAADNAENVHGILSLYQGLNGKYRPYSASMAPFPYTAGTSWKHISTRGKSDYRWYAFAGDNCREIYSVRVVFNRWGSAEEDMRNFYETTFELPEPNFLWLFEEGELEQMLDIPEIDGRLMVWEMQLLDRDGNDVTEQYQDGSIEQSWGGGKESAEMGLLYAYMGIVAVLGVIFIRYFLRRD